MASDTPSTAGRTCLELFIRESIYFINLYIVLRFDIQSVERRFYIPGPRKHLPPHLSRRRQAVSRASAPFSRYVLPVRLIPDERDVLSVCMCHSWHIYTSLCAAGSRSCLRRVGRRSGAKLYILYTYTYLIVSHYCAHIVNYLSPY